MGNFLCRVSTMQFLQLKWKVVVPDSNLHSKEMTLLVRMAKVTTEDFSSSFPPESFNILLILKKKYPECRYIFTQ